MDHAWTPLSFDTMDLEWKPARSSLSRFVDVIAVNHEPGLSHAQLMLTNYDLKPGKCSGSRYVLIWGRVLIEVRL